MGLIARVKNRIMGRNFRHFLRLALAFVVFASMNGASFKQSAHAAVPEETLAEAEALLTLIAQNKDLDAYLHSVELKQELSITEDDQRRSEIYKEIIFHALDMGDSETLEEFSELALELAYRIEDTELRIYGELAKANLLAADGELKKSRQAIESARALAERTNDPISVFFADAMLAFIGPEMGNFLEGLSQLAQGTVTLPDTPRGNRMRMLAYLTIAYTYTGVGEASEIISNYNKAAELGIAKGIAFDRESVFFNVASTLSDDDENETAKKYFLALKDVLSQTGREDGNYYVLYGLAWIAYDEKNYADTIKLAETAIKDYPEDPYFNSSLDDLIAISYAKLGDPVKARVYMERSRTFFTANPELEGSAPDAQHKLTLAYVLRAEGKLEEAFETLNDARRTGAIADYEQFKSSVTDLRSNLEAMLAKQQAEERLEVAEDANSRLILIFSVLMGLGALLLLIMQRRHTRALQKSMYAAELANKTKSDFLANMSHELRTPLNAILGFSEMMDQQVFGKLGAKQYEDYAKHIHGSGRHLLDIINDILDLSKVESGRLVLEETDIDLKEMFEDARAMLVPKARDRGVEIGMHVDKGVPQLRADWRLVKQILLNLLSNGVKFTEAKGRVNLIAHVSDERQIQIEVIDSGIGMDPEELEEALTPFGQAGTTMTRSHEGTGLGLPLVKSLVELHGGELFIRSKKNLGTTIQIMMPAERSVS
jgi:signal transduction histidine kinase